jgi:uncharacterized protein YmfQ (DUF2313 family)
MARSYTEYRKLLQSLLPKGKLWTRSRESTLTEFLNALADEFARLDARVDDLHDERDVRTTDELIAEHEFDFGLPADGEELGATTAIRRNELHAKLLETGNQMPSYFIEVAEGMGYTVTVTEYCPCWVGVAQCGDAVGNQVNVFYYHINVWVTDDMNVNITALKNTMERIKPAHAIVLLRFYDRAFDFGFSNGFESFPWFDGINGYGGFNPVFDTGFQNNFSYDGAFLVGGFESGFSIGFDNYPGGGFTHDDFSTGFLRPT